ncbi:MAG TPA: hypothetical protein VHW65_09610 [Gemmatimonadales bacterium]|nr:hypothetical protein [Gemmatimonadales bacterium]
MTITGSTFVAHAFLTAAMLVSGGTHATADAPCTATITGAVSGTTPCILQLVGLTGKTVLSITTQPFGPGTSASGQLILQAAIEIEQNTSTGSWTDATVSQSAVSVIRTGDAAAWVESTGQPRQGTMALALTRLGTPAVVGPVSRWTDVDGTLHATLPGQSGQVTVAITFGGKATTTTTASIPSTATATPRTLFKPTLSQFAGHPALQPGMTIDAFLHAVQPQIGPGENPPAPRNGRVLAPTTKPCPGGGSVTISETVPASSTGASAAVATLTYTVTYKNCGASGTTMDGSVNMTFSVSNDDGSSGGSGGAGTSSGHATTTADGGPVTMTIGSSAPTTVMFHHLASNVSFLASLSGSSVRCATVIASPSTGSMTFGTSTYTPSAAEAAAVFGAPSGMPKC